MRKSIFKIISKKDGRVLTSIKCRRGSDGAREFIAAFKRGYTEINQSQGLTDDIQMYELIEDCGYDRIVVNSSIDNNDLKRLDYVEVDPNYTQTIYAGIFEIPF